MPRNFPQEAHLRDGRRLLVRPFTSGDVDALHAFFLKLPHDWRRFAWDRIDQRATIEKPMFRAPRWGMRATPSTLWYSRPCPACSPRPIS